MEAAVVCSNVAKTYRSEGSETPALRGVDLEVQKGELLMLVGPSGCGKTTLISVIAGILNQDSGACSVFGADVRSLPDAEKTAFRGRNIGFVFQSFNLIPQLTVVENVAIPLLLFKVERREALARAAEILREVGLGEKIHVQPAQLSGGQQQRVAIARSLVHEPQLIVCDEPTSSLDHKTGLQVMELFSKVALKDKRTVIIVTHDSRIFQFADRIASMDDGVITKVETGKHYGGVPNAISSTTTST